MVEAIEGAGTPESEWMPFLAGLALPELVVDPPPARAVVVAPHPDDEVLAVGGLLRLLADLGTAIEVVAVTDGEASHPNGLPAPAALAKIRAQELRAALDALGVTAPILRLRLPDGGGDALEDAVAEALGLDVATWLLAPWRGDGHPDHEAVGRAAARAAAGAGARLLEFPVWAWHWDSPEQSRLPWQQARSVQLTETVRNVKRRAVAAFTSQLAPRGPGAEDPPVLPPHVLARFQRSFEVVLG